MTNFTVLLYNENLTIIFSVDNVKNNIKKFVVYYRFIINLFSNMIVKIYY